MDPGPNTQPTPRKAERRRNVALLDVDHTLKLGDNSLNLPLLECLFQCGIDHAYLFTDMTFNSPAIEDRNELVKELEELGMAIHGVITPSDVTWPQMDDAECLRLYSMCFSEGLYTGRLHGAEFERFIASQSDQLPSLGRAVTDYNPYDPDIVLGGAFNDASMELFMQKETSDLTRVKSVLAKSFCDHLSEKLGYNHPKGLLLDLFVRRREFWAGGIIVADDNGSVIQDVEGFVPAVGVAINRQADLESQRIDIPVITALHITSSSTSLMFDIVQRHVEKTRGSISPQHTT